MSRTHIPHPSPCTSTGMACKVSLPCCRKPAQEGEQRQQQQCLGEPHWGYGRGRSPPESGLNYPQADYPVCCLTIWAAFIWFNLGPESESFICTTQDKSAFISLDRYNFRTDPLTYFTSVQSWSLIYSILCDPYFALSHFIVFPDNRELTVPHINSKHGCNKVTQGTQEMIN